MAYQNLSKEPQKVSCLANLKGWDILGIPLKAPLAKYPVIYTLPMLTISPKKGTGIVTSVPRYFISFCWYLFCSDAPDDYINLEELKRKPAFREKYHIKDDMVAPESLFSYICQIMPFEIVPIIDVPGYGNLAAQKACNDMKIKSPNDRDLLDQAKELVYQAGFYQGTMLVGEHKGKSVKDAKPSIKEKMIEAGEAVVYSEPAAQV